MKESTHKIAIVVKFINPTNYRGSRVSMTLPRFGNKKKVVGWEYDKGTSSNRQAEAWLNAHGIECDTLLDMHKYYVIACLWSQREKIFKAFGIPEVK